MRKWKNKVFVDINLLSEEKDKPGYMRVLGLVLIEDKIETNTGIVPFLILKTIANELIDKQSLDIQYPGWEDRYRIHSALGRENDAYLSQVFNNNAAPPQSLGLTNVTFD